MKQCTIRFRARHAFGLVELLVAIGLIAVLLAISQSVLQRLSDAGKATKCVSNLRQIGAAHMAYIAENNGYLISAAVVSVSKNIYWYHVLEPYMGDPELSPLSPNRPGWQLCPAKVIAPLTRETVGYGWNYKNFGYNDKQEKPAQIADGFGTRITDVSRPSHTIIIGDSKDQDVNSSSASHHQHRYLYTSELPSSISPLFARRHKGGGNYLFVDGHVEGFRPEQLAENHKLFLKAQ